MPYITDNEWTRYEVVEDSPVLYMNTTEWVQHMSFPSIWYILKKSSKLSESKYHNCCDCWIMDCPWKPNWWVCISQTESDNQDFLESIHERKYLCYDFQIWKGKYWIPLRTEYTKYWMNFKFNWNEVAIEIPEEHNKKDFWKELISFMRKEWLFFWNKGSHQKIKEFLSSNWYL